MSKSLLILELLNQRIEMELIEKVLDLYNHMNIININFINFSFI